MKKMIIAVAFTMASAVPGMAAAAEIFEGDYYALALGQNAPTGFSGAECALVADNVRLGVSANVVGGFACDEANNLVQVAACHSGGSRSSGVLCSSDADLNTAAVDLPPGCTDTTGSSTQPSFRAFTLASSGGVMSEAALSGRCTTTTLSGITWIQ